MILNDHSQPRAAAHKSFKRLVRARMEKTGERHSAARANLLAGQRSNGDEPPLVTSDDAIRERARGGRAVGEHEEGFAISVSRTVAVPVERLFDAFADESQRSRWLPGADLRERTATRPKSWRDRLRALKAELER